MPKFHVNNDIAKLIELKIQWTYLVVGTPSIENVNFLLLSDYIHVLLYLIKIVKTSLLFYSINTYYQFLIDQVLILNSVCIYVYCSEINKIK